jgi:hypothetical protein
MKFEKFIRQPNETLYPGIYVTKDTEVEFENELVKQTIKDLFMETKMSKSGDGYETEMISKIRLEEGDILILEEDGRGYIKPRETFMKVSEAIEELKCVAATIEE